MAGWGKRDAGLAVILVLLAVSGIIVGAALGADGSSNSSTVKDGSTYAETTEPTTIATPTDTPTETPTETPTGTPSPVPTEEPSPEADAAQVTLCHLNLEPPSYWQNRYGEFVRSNAVVQCWRSVGSYIRLPVKVLSVDIQATLLRLQVDSEAVVDAAVTREVFTSIASVALAHRCVLADGKRWSYVAEAQVQVVTMDDLVKKINFRTPPSIIRCL